MTKEQNITTHNNLEYAVRKINKLKANLESPAFTGTPTAPTMPKTDVSTAIATTAFVKASIPANTEEVKEALQQIELINNVMFDKIVSSSDPTVFQKQDGCYISTSYTYGTGIADFTLYRYKVNPGDKIKISGYTLAKNHALWITANNSAFSNVIRKGPLYNTGSQILYVDTTLTMASNETYLFVTKNTSLDVVVLEDVVEGKLTQIQSSIQELSDETSIIDTKIDDCFGDIPLDHQIAMESYKFLDRIQSSIYYPVTAKKKAHFCYFIPDIHRRFECLPQHLTIFANSYGGTKPDSAGYYGLYNQCRVAVTAGDILYSGGTLTSREDLLGAFETFVENCISWSRYGVNLLPTIGGHDFNEYSNAGVNHDNKKVGDNLTKYDQRKKLIEPSLGAVKYGLTKYLPTTPSGTTVKGTCYYYVKDNTTGDYFIMLDECDHSSVVTGTYNDATVEIDMNTINWVNSTFSGTSLDGTITYTNVPFGDFEYKYSRYKNVTYSQEQLTWLINVLSSAPAGTKIWIFNHSGVTNELSDNSGARTAIRNILKAFVNRSTYVGSGSSTDGDITWSVNVDFTGAGGILVGVFRGHSHKCTTMEIDGTYYEFTSDTPGHYSSSVSSSQEGVGKVSGDLFQYEEDDEDVYRYHFGRRYAGIDAVPTSDEKLASLEERVAVLEGIVNQ